MDSSYVERYSYLYHNHWWWQARKSFVLELVKRDLEVVNDQRARILDVGCGDGFFFPELSELGYYEGIEPTADLVSDKGRQKGVIHLTDFVSFASEKRFDRILFLDVLEHIDDDVAFLAHAKSVLNETGQIVITVPAGEILFNSHDRLNNHRRRYTSPSLRRLIISAGFEPILIKYEFLWPAISKLFVRAVEALLKRDIRSDGIPPQWINRCLVRACIAEKTVLDKIGYHPWGSSLFAVIKLPKNSGQPNM